MTSDFVMTYTCSNGHSSTEADYCSLCGTRIAGAGAPSAAAPASVGSAASAAAPADAPDDAAAVPADWSCPNCDSDLDAGSRFCEVCGYDPNTGSLPQAPVVQPASPIEPGADTSAPPGRPAAGAGTWVAVVAADRPYYDRNQVTEVQFPLGVPARTIELVPGIDYTIGRRSRTRGTFPAIDLAGPPEDAAVSHTHAGILSKDDGSWELVDHGSTNGTYVNESSDPIASNTPIPLVPGDRVYVGAWTQITIELRP